MQNGYLISDVCQIVVARRLDTICFRFVIAIFFAASVIGLSSGTASPGAAPLRQWRSAEKPQRAGALPKRPCVTTSYLRKNDLMPLKT